MRKLGTAVALAVVLVACQAAQARLAFAGVDVLTHDGRCKVASNWSLGVTPGAFNAVVPAGKTLRAEGGPCAMRSLLLEGNLVGQGAVRVGDPLRPEGPAGQDVALKIAPGATWIDQGLTLTGGYLGAPQILDFGPSQISNVVFEGSAHYQLGEPARFESIWTMKEGSWLDTAGYWVGGMGDTQVGLAATLKLHGSEWDTGEWRVAANVNLEAQDATVYQDDGSYGITECHGQTLGNLIVENFRPHLLDNCTIPGTLSLLQTADHSPVVFAGAFLPDERAAPTISVGELASNGTPERPVVTEGHVKIVLPHPEEVTAVLDVKDWTVEGGPLYLPNSAPDPSNTGVIYTPQP